MSLQADSCQGVKVFGDHIQQTIAREKATKLFKRAPISLSKDGMVQRGDKNISAKPELVLQRMTGMKSQRNQARYWYSAQPERRGVAGVLSPCEPSSTAQSHNCRHKHTSRQRYSMYTSVVSPATSALGSTTSRKWNMLVIARKESADWLKWPLFWYHLVHMAPRMICSLE
jgi:hypothetical protein